MENWCLRGNSGAIASKRQDVRLSARRVSARKGKENDSQQSQNIKNENVQDKGTRRMMMELTDLRARSRELRELTQKQKADQLIEERIASEHLRDLQDENRTLKEKLSSRQQLSRASSPSQTAGDGDASGGGERRGLSVSALAAAAGKAAHTAVANAIARQDRANTRMLQRPGMEVPRLSLKSTGSSTSTAVDESHRPAPGTALQHLATGCVSPTSRERFVRIIEEHVAALRKEIDDLKDMDDPSSQVSRPRLREGCGSGGGRRRRSSDVQERKTLAVQIPATPTTVSPRLPASVEAPSSRPTPTLDGSSAGRCFPPSRGVSPRGRIGSGLSPRLDESCNSARDSVHSMHTKLDKMNDHIHDMLLDGTAAVAETARLLAKSWVSPSLKTRVTSDIQEEISPETSPPISPTSFLTASTSNAGTERGDCSAAVKFRHNSAIDEFDRVSQFLAQHTQEVDDVQALRQRLSGQEHENKALRNRLQQVECFQRNCQREMRSLKQQVALRSSRSSEVSSRQSRSSFGCGTPVEDAERWCQLSSTPSDTSPSMVLQATTRPAATKAAYCWPSAPPAMCWPVLQRGTEDPTLNIPGRGQGIRRSISMVGPSVHCRRLVHRSASLSAPLDASSGDRTPCPYAAGSATLRMEAPSAQLQTSSSTPALLRSASLPMTRGRSSSPLPIALPISQSSGLNAHSAPVSRSPSPKPKNRKAASLAVTPGLALSRSPSPVEAPVVAANAKEPRVLVKIRDSPPRRVLPEGSTLHRSHWRLLNQ